jgi:hypothetical protein
MFKDWLYAIYIYMVDKIDYYIKKFNEKWDNKYDYSLFDHYINTKQKINIICKKHGVFSQRIDSHLVAGCKNCSDDNRRLSIDSFIKKSSLKHNNLYDYSKVTYISSSHNVEIVCKKHGSFLQTPHNHLRGTGCPKCNGGISYDNNIFIEKASYVHNNKYSYENCNYKKANIKVTITCPTHGNFKQLPFNHIIGRGCPKCGIKYGKMENDWLDIYNIKKDYRQYKINNFFVDGFDPKTNTIFEFYGDFFHGNPNIYKKDEMNLVSNKTYGELYELTIKRERVLKSFGYNLIFIWEDDYKKIYKK